MAHAKATIGIAHYAVEIDAGGHRIVADEPAANGGANAGPDPYGLLLASLAACTAITLRMYADRKAWDLKSLRVELQYLRREKEERIARKIRPSGDLTEEQCARLAEIAERTPVTLTLKRGLPIETTLVRASSAAQEKPALDARLDEALEETFPASDPPAVTPRGEAR